MHALKTPLIKASATGNDFLIVDLIAHAAAWKEDGDKAAAGGSKPFSRAALVKAWCDRHFGIGADGAVFIEPHDRLDFVWDFYNSDGGNAEMCGNAARAVSLYMAKKASRPDWRFQTGSGVVESRVLSAHEVDVTLAPIASSAFKQRPEGALAAALNTGPARAAGAGTEFTYDFIVAGVPHAVVKVSELNDIAQLEKTARAIKAEDRFKVSGTNVTFVRARTPELIESVTFERGVENFTLSCGTGAVAASHSILRGQENRRLEVQVPGGRLSVLFKEGRPHLIGPAEIIAEVRWCKSI